MHNARQMPEDIRLRAYADIRVEAAQRYFNEYGGAYYTPDSERIFRDDHIDLIFICTHHDSHMPLAVKAAEAGKHIFLEKPMAKNADECQRIADAVAKAGIKLTVDYKFRFTPVVQKVKELIPHPIITVGQLAMNRAVEGQGAFWVFDQRLGGGLVNSTGCHTIDLVYYLNEVEPVRVYAEGKAFAPRGDRPMDGLVGTIQFANGAIASVIMADHGQNDYISKWFHEVFDGQRSAVIYDHTQQVTFSGTEIQKFSAYDLPVAEKERASGTFWVLRDLIDAIRENRRPKIDVRDGLRTTLLADKLVESAMTGQPLAVPAV
jgi:predicted dehydrogenase